MSTTTMLYEPRARHFVGAVCGALAIAAATGATLAQRADILLLRRLVQNEPVQSPKPPPAAPAVSAAITNWQHALIARIDRFKRYPARANGAEGIVELAFAIDRKGAVVSSRIAKSSGSAALDADALALIKRASPLPPPPDGVADADLSFVVPIRYTVGGQR